MVKLVPQEGGESIDIKAKRSTKIERLIAAWAEQKRVSAQSIRLAFEGRRLQPNQTLAETGVEENDQLDVFLEQLGG